MEMQVIFSLKLVIVMGDVPRQEAIVHSREDLLIEAMLLEIKVKSRACD